MELTAEESSDDGSNDQPEVRLSPEKEHALHMLDDVIEEAEKGMGFSGSDSDSEGEPAPQQRSHDDLKIIDLETDESVASFEKSTPPELIRWCRWDWKGRPSTAVLLTRVVVVTGTTDTTVLQPPPPQPPVVQLEEDVSPDMSHVSVVVVGGENVQVIDSSLSSHETNGNVERSCSSASHSSVASSSLASSSSMVRTNNSRNVVQEEAEKPQSQNSVRVEGTTTTETDDDIIQTVNGKPKRLKDSEEDSWCHGQLKIHRRHSPRIAARLRHPNNMTSKKKTLLVQSVLLLLLNRNATSRPTLSKRLEEPILRRFLPPKEDDEDQVVLRKSRQEEGRERTSHRARGQAPNGADNVDSGQTANRGEGDDDQSRVGGRAQDPSVQGRHRQDGFETQDSKTHSKVWNRRRDGDDNYLPKSSTEMTTINDSTTTITSESRSCGSWNCCRSKSRNSSKTWPLKTTSAASSRTSASNRNEGSWSRTTKTTCNPWSTSNGSKDDKAEEQQHVDVKVTSKKISCWTGKGIEAI